MATKANGAAPHSRAAAIRAAREATKATRETTFPLVATGGEAIVRRLDLLELIALDAIPVGLQALVNDVIEASIGGSTDGAAPSDAEAVRVMGGGLAALKQQQALADVACLAGFIDPRLVATAAEVTDPETELPLAEIERSDRLAYWTWCQGGELPAALATVFPEPAAAAAARPPGNAVQHEPVDVPLRVAPAVRR
jgi:hypothetical protein